ncbi:alpha/beta hydrolase [Nonomuraea sp. NPDC050663]|uniref:alpha/beta hydrolase n=1 Tax=Nonomuraea sp. NPDC050663 TaxID=3364370 RepID=UPI003788FAB9
MIRTMAVAAALGLTLAWAVPVAARAAAPPPPVAWTPCPENPAVECGTVEVPVDWARPHGPTLQVALARRKATRPDARIASLVINPGGPGGSGVDTVLAGGPFSTHLTERFDLVGFDPRGVGRSHPVVCSPDLLAAVPTALDNQADFDRWLAYNQRLRDDCRARTGELYDHVDTLSVVHDLDAIRQALGEHKLTFYGVSYGTLIGQQYAERFPRHVRALALDSNVDHSLGIHAFLDTQAAFVQDSFDEFVAWCERDSACALHGQPVRDIWAGLLSRAEEGTLADPSAPGRPLTPIALIGTVRILFYGPQWRELGDYLRALRDDGSSPPAVKSLQETPFPAQAILCRDWSLPVRSYREWAAHLQRMRSIAPDMRYSALAVNFVAICLGHPGPVTNPQHRLRVRGSAPMLLVNALHDPATGHEWAANVSEQLGDRAVLLTYEGWGHAAYHRGPCVTRAVDDFLTSLVLPPRETRCPAVPPTTGPL